MADRPVESAALVLRRHHARELAIVTRELYPSVHVMLRERYRTSTRRRVKGTASR